MLRQTYTATLTNDDGVVLATQTRYAMNSAIRMTETLLRDLARVEGVTFTGQTPDREGAVYTRVWVSSTGRVITARAQQVEVLQIVAVNFLGSDGKVKVARVERLLPVANA